MDDEFDIYNDLEEFDWQQKYLEQSESLKEEQSKALTALNRISALENDILKFKQLNDNLKHNMNVTLTTFSKEVARKDGQILQLRKEKDNICFRRAPPTNDFRIPKKPPSFSFGTQTDLVYNITTTTQTDFVSPGALKTENDKTRKWDPERDSGGKYENRNSNRNNNKYSDLREEIRKKNDFDDRNSRYRTNDRHGTSKYEPKLIQEPPRKNDRHFSRREDDRSDKRKWSPERNKSWDSNKRGRYERKDSEPTQREKDDDLLVLESQLAAIRKAIATENVENREPEKARSVHSDDSKKSRSDDGQRKPMKSRRMSVYVKESSPVKEFTCEAPPLPVLTEEKVPEDPARTVLPDVKDQLQKVPDEKWSSEPLRAVSSEKQKNKVPEDENSKSTSVKPERSREAETKSEVKSIEKSNRSEGHSKDPSLEPLELSADQKKSKMSRRMSVHEKKHSVVEKVPESLPTQKDQVSHKSRRKADDKPSKDQSVEPRSTVEESYKKSGRSREEVPEENKLEEKSKEHRRDPSLSGSSDDKGSSVHEKEPSQNILVVENVPEPIPTQTGQVPLKSRRREDNQSSKDRSVEPRSSGEESSSKLERSKEEVPEEKKPEEKPKEHSRDPTLSESVDDKKSKSRRKSVHESEPSQNIPVDEKVPELFNELSVTAASKKQTDKIPNKSRKQGEDNKHPKDRSYPEDPYKKSERSREDLLSKNKLEEKSKDLSMKPSMEPSLPESSDDKKSKRSRRISTHERKQDIPIVEKVAEPIPSVSSKDKVSDERSSKISKRREENKTSDYDSSLVHKKNSRSRSKELPVNKKKDEKPSALSEDLSSELSLKTNHNLLRIQKVSEIIKEVSETVPPKVLPVESTKEPHKKSRREADKTSKGSKEPSSEPYQSESSKKSRRMSVYEKVPEQSKSSENVSKVSSEQVPEDKSIKRSKIREDKNDSRKPKDPSLEPSVSKSEDVPKGLNGKNVPESTDHSVEPLHSEISKIQESQSSPQGKEEEVPSMKPLQSVPVPEQAKNVPIKETETLKDLPLEPSSELTKDLRVKAEKERRKSLYVPEEENPDEDEDCISKFTGRNKKSKMSRRMSIFFGDDSVDGSMQQDLPHKTEVLPKKTEDHSDINLIINRKTGKVRRSSESVPVHKEGVQEAKVPVPKQDSLQNVDDKFIANISSKITAILTKSKAELAEKLSKTVKIEVTKPSPEKGQKNHEKSKKSSRRHKTEESQPKSVPSETAEVPTIVITAASRKSFDPPKVEELHSILKSPCSKSPAKKKVRISDEFIPQPTNEVATPQTFTNMADLLNTPMKVTVVEPVVPATEKVIYMKSRRRSATKSSSKNEVAEEVKPTNEIANAIENEVVCLPHTVTVVTEEVKPTNQVLKSIENSSEVVCPPQKETVVSTVEPTEKRKSNGSYKILEVIGTETVIMMNRKRKKTKK